MRSVSLLALLLALTPQGSDAQTDTLEGAEIDVAGECVCVLHIDTEQFMRNCERSQPAGQSDQVVVCRGEQEVTVEVTITDANWEVLGHDDPRCTNCETGPDRQSGLVPSHEDEEPSEIQ